MSIRGLSIIVLGAAALSLAGYASSSTAGIIVVANPITKTGTFVNTDRSVTVDVKPTPLPTRPPGRSLYRPGPRPPVSSLE
jgi:hypothetical protein